MGNAKILFKKIKKDSTLSPIRITATALAAISMSLLSSYLTSLFSTFIIAGILSITTALIVEAYRIIIFLTADNTKKIIKPLSKRVEDPEDEIFEEELSNQSKVTSFTKFAFIFSLFSLITIGVSYGVSSFTEKDSVINEYQISTFESNLTDEEKESIINEASDKTKNELIQEILSLQESIKNQELESSNLSDSMIKLSEELEAQREDYLLLIEDLQNQIDNINSQNDQPTEPTVTPDPVS